LDGQPLAKPLKDGYAGTGLDASPNGQGLTRLAGVQVYREFVFVRLSPEGLDFDAYFGDALRAIDNMVERSPVGRLEVAGGVLRNTMACNWKMYLENINDTVHPVSAHESASSVARQMWQQQPSGAPMPMAMEQILPFANGYDYFGVCSWRNSRNGNYCKSNAARCCHCDCFTSLPNHCYFTFS
jgi:phenylpropionate dioxygenase-like ring-hydroxylating dioxygenase large terminal subunit